MSKEITKPVVVGVRDLRADGKRRRKTPPLMITVKVSGWVGPWLRLGCAVTRLGYWILGRKFVVEIKGESDAG
jgi:hypothetical protein